MTYCEVLIGDGMCPNDADRTVNVHWQHLDPPVTAQVHMCEHHYQAIHDIHTEGE